MDVPIDIDKFNKLADEIEIEWDTFVESNFGNQFLKMFGELISSPI